MRRADRLFDIIQLLRTRKLTTARWLAERLEVSDRTIYRDIQDLIASGVPIDGEAGVGYILRRGYDLPPLMFDTEELTALVLGARMVVSQGDKQLARAAQQVLSKVATVLPDALQSGLDQVPLYSPSVHDWRGDTLNLLRCAIRDQRKVRFSYTRADGMPSQRQARPLALFYWGAVWTLGAWCELRQALRNFRIDRIEQLCATEEGFAQEPGKTIDDLLAEERRQWEDFSDG